MDLLGLIEAAGRVGGLSGAGPGARRIWEETRGWVGRLMLSATEKWLPYYGRSEPCAVRVLKNGVPFPCTATAVLPCAACGAPACLGHAQVDQFGDGTCYGCIAETIAKKRAERGAAPPHGQAPGAPPIDMAREACKRALAVLGLKEGATWAEIRQAHRTKAAALHPDRAKTEAKRRSNEEKSKLVNAALADLHKFYKPEAA